MPLLRLCLYGMLLGDLYLYRSEKVRFLLGNFLCYVIEKNF